MKVRFDIDVDAWIKGIEVNADSVEEAKRKLYSMSIEEMLAQDEDEGNGWVKDFQVQKDYTTYDIVEETIEAEVQGNFEDSGDTFKTTVSVVYAPEEQYDLEDILADEVEYKFNREVDRNTFQYKITKRH